MQVAHAAPHSLLCTHAHATRTLVCAAAHMPSPHTGEYEQQPANPALCNAPPTSTHVHTSTPTCYRTRQPPKETTAPPPLPCPEAFYTIPAPGHPLAVAHPLHHCNSGYAPWHNAAHQPHCCLHYVHQPLSCECTCGVCCNAHSCAHCCAVYAQVGTYLCNTCPPQDKRAAVCRATKNMPQVCPRSRFQHLFKIWTKPRRR